MKGNHVDEYMIWRVDWLERRYWKYTKVVRLSGAAAFLPLIALLAGVLVYGREEPFTRLRIIAYAVVALFVTVTLMIHAHARNRRRDIEEELAVLYSFPPTQPFHAPHPDPTPAGFDNVDAGAFEPIQSR